MTKSTTTFDVVLVPFPFADLSATKRRPCLVLATDHPRNLPAHVLVCMMTSQVEGIRFSHDRDVKDLKHAGLPKATLVRVSKMVTLESDLIVKKLGSLGEADRKEVRAALRAFLGKAMTP